MSFLEIFFFWARVPSRRNENRYVRYIKGKKIKESRRAGEQREPRRHKSRGLREHNRYLRMKL